MSEKQSETEWLREQYCEMQKTAIAATARAESALSREQNRSEDLERTKNQLSKCYRQLAIHFLIHGAAFLTITGLVFKFLKENN